MWPFPRRLTVTRARVLDLEEQLADVQKAVEWLRKADRDLNARFASLSRQVKEPAPAAGTGEPLEPSPPASAGNYPASADTTHLARKFRGF